jgi:MFS family permease
MRTSVRPPVGERVYTPVILALAVIVGTSFLGVGFVLPLRALYAQRIGASSIEIGLMASVSLLTGFLAAPGIGWLSDRVGARTVLVVGIVFHALLVLLYIPINDPVLLIGLRALEGIAIVAVLPPARALMNQLAPPTRQGEALGLVGSAQMVGILMGPVLGTLLASQVGYTQAFLVASLPLFAGAALALVLLPRQTPRHAAYAMGAGVTVVPGALFAPALWLTYGLNAVAAVTTGIITSVWSIYMLQRGASLPVIGLTYTAFAVPTGLLAPLAGRLSDRRGRYWPIVIGLFAYAGIYVVFGLPIAPVWFVIFSFLEGFPAATTRSATDGLLADVMPAGMRGKAQANYSAAGTAGSFIGATAAGLLYAVAPGLPFTVAGALFLVTALALFLPALARLFHSGRGVSRPPD